MRLASLAARTAATLAVAAGVCACGGGSEDEAAAPAPAPAQATAAAPAFPATVEHKFGTTTVPSEPKRIVVVGLTEHDTLLALGIKPVAVTEWYGEQPHATWPWAREALGDAQPTVLKTTNGFQFEKIASLRPDLIIGTNSGMKNGDYKKLSALAPTVAAGKGSTEYFSPWDEQAVLIASAVGKKAEGEKLVAGIKAQFAKVASEHPEFKGKVATFAQNAFYSGLLYVYPEGLDTHFLSDLGFTINPALTPLVKKKGEQVTISPERLDVIDTDVIVFATEDPKDIKNFEKVPTFRRLKAVQEHRAVFTDPTLAGAIYFTSPLSLPYVLEKLTPQLAAAVKGEAPRRIVGTSDA